MEMKLLFLLITVLGSSHVVAAALLDCGTNFSMQHGYADFTGRNTTVHHKVPVFCVPGYELHGDSHTVCLESGAWSTNSSCHIIHCSNTHHIEHGHVGFIGTVTPYGHITPLFCMEGYEHHGDHYLTCLADGSWSNSSCRLTDCGSEYHLQHGHANFRGRHTTVNHTVPVHCNEGYNLQGDHHITCQPDGKWSRYTNCHEINCGKTFTIEHGYVDYTGHQSTYNHSLPIHCEQGYVLEGALYTTCQSDGTWTHNTICRIKECQSTYHMDHGHAEFGGRATTYGAIVPVFCASGYEISGNHRYITCLATGEWSKAVCVPKDCGNSYSINNGMVDFTGKHTTVNHSVPVHCNDGYEFQGHDHITCNANGMWSRFTRCKGKSCGTYVHIENGFANFGHEITTGHIIPVTCKEGFHIQGDPHITCHADGQWSNTTSCQLIDCGRNYSLPNGHVHYGEKTTYNSTLYPHCNKGYKVVGDYDIICQADGTWSTNTSCVIHDCGRNYSLPNGHVHYGNKTTYNSTLYPHCNEGYKIVGDYDIICQADGTWSTNTSCVIQDCGRNYSLPNGHVHYGNKTTYNSTLYPHCNKGYKIVGDYDIICQADGTWSTNTSCVIQDCGRNYSLTNGHVHYGNKTTYNSTLYPHCNKGYNVVGDYDIICQADGTWSTNTSCVIQDCGRNYSLPNGHVHYGNKTTYNSTLYPHCNEGYKIVGDYDIICQADGTWSTNTSCVIQDCGRNYSLPNGHVHYGNKTTYNSTLYPHCIKGYKIVGDYDIICQADGTWSTNTSCVIQDCGRNYSLPNGHVHYGNKTTYNSTLYPHCNKGYKIVGDYDIICQADGTWSTNTSCEIVDCGRNYSLPHGHVHYGNKTTYNHTLYPHCNKGYKVEGDYDIICQADGTWSTNTSCEIVDCGRNYSLPNGHVHYGNKTTYNSTLYPHCNKGYKVVGDYDIICQADGTWSTNTSCEIVDCGRNYSLPNGHVHYGDNTTYNSTLYPHCNTGYKVVGDYDIICQADGTWSTNTSCEIVDCGRNYSLSNGHVHYGDNTTYNSTLYPHCNKGYKVVGDYDIICQADGTWSTNTSCVIHDCGREYNLTNGHVHFGNLTTYNQTLYPHCNDGYYVVGDYDIICQADGTWSTNTSCEIVDCGREYILTNGHVHFGNLTTYNQTLYPHCNDGYYIEGDYDIICQADGNWSTNTFCIVQDCGDVYNLPHGHVNFGNETTYNQTARVHCDDGYYIEGDQHITCTADGNWTKNTYCKVTDCGDVYHVKNGHVNFTGRDTHFNQTIPVTCFPGYTIRGDNHIVCLATGHWRMTSYFEPDCSYCGTSYTIPHGHANFTGGHTTYNHSVPIICNNGYVLHGDHFTTCLSNGSWSEGTSCVSEDCGDVYTLEHGHVNFTNRETTFNHTIPVACNEGYNIVGDGHITCLASGEWSSNTHCAIKECAASYSIHHGHVNFTGKALTYGATIPVTCNVGYYTETVSSITCHSDGSWTGPTACRLRECGVGYSIDHGSVSFLGIALVYNAKVTVTCDSGYEIEGDSKITCLATGEWSTNTACRLIPEAESNTGAIIGWAVGGGVAAVVVITLLVLLVAKVTGTMCFTKSYTLSKASNGVAP